MPIGLLCKCKSNNNGEPLFFWERWRQKEFLFKKNQYYTYILLNNKIFVINEKHVPIEFEVKYFRYLFKT